MDNPEVVAPFRWNITQRHRLGSLLAGHADEFDDWLQSELDGLGRLPGTVDTQAAPLDWLLNELRRAAAHVLASSANADLVFVGRSPESLFDYMSGLLADTSWATRLHLLHFSMRGVNDHQALAESPVRRQAMRRYLGALQLSPQSLLHRPHPVAFVDIVASGTTLGNLVRFMAHWADEQRVAWRALRQKLRIIGLTQRTHTSPNTWRWQQQVDWASLLPTNAIQNVSIPPALFHYLGGAQAKTTTSYSPSRWGDEQVLAPLYDTKRLHALRLAVLLYDTGQQRADRHRFVQELSTRPAVRERWLRAVMREVIG